MRTTLNWDKIFWFDIRCVITVQDCFKQSQSNEIKSSSLTRNVLLTGSNGFLGIHLLYEILATTSDTVYCHIRAKDKVIILPYVVLNVSGGRKIASASI
jgi:hypothetical protein